MKQFEHVVRDPLGIHARPAGLLARIAKDFPDVEISVAKSGNAVRAGQLMKLMGLGVKQGDRVTVTAQGPSEAAAIDAMRAFFAENL